MKGLAVTLAVALSLAPSVARAGDPTPSTPSALALEPAPLPAADSPYPFFARANYLRILAGVGRATTLPIDDTAASTNLGIDFGHYPLRGALDTGLSVSWAADAHGYWSVITPGVFVALDLTYIFMTALWQYIPPAPRFRLRLGERLGLGISQSTRPKQDVPDEPAYELIRPELQSFLDVEVPVDRSKMIYAVFVRAAADTSVNVSEMFRWSFSLGVTYGFDGAEMPR